MRALLDTHAFLWWVADSRRLSEAARDAIRNEANDIVVSAVSAWEIATKHRLGRLPEAGGLAGNIRGAIVGQGFSELPISVADAERSGRLPGPHRDPSIAYTGNVVRSFLRYQLTAYPFADTRLHDQMRDLLSLDEARRSPPLKGPYVRLSRPFRQGEAVSRASSVTGMVIVPSLSSAAAFISLSRPGWALPETELQVRHPTVFPSLHS